jgi:hypothetical protein
LSIKWPNKGCWSGPKESSTPLHNLILIEHNPQRVLEEFRRGEFDQIEIFDPGGIFVGDGSYLFVPDNPAFRGKLADSIGK